VAGRDAGPTALRISVAPASAPAFFGKNGQINHEAPAIGGPHEGYQENRKCGCGFVSSGSSLWFSSCRSPEAILGVVV